MLSWQGSVGATDPDLATGLRDLRVVQAGGQEFVITSTGMAGGLISYRLSDTAPPVEVDRAYTPDGTAEALSGQLSQITLNGQLYVVTGADASGRLVGYSVSNTGQLGSRALLDGPQALAGGPVHLATGAGDLLWLAGQDDTGGYIRGFQPDGQGGYTPATLIRDSDASYLANPVALDVIRQGNTDYVITLAGTEAGVSVFAATPGTGALSLVSAMGLREGLGILPAPQALEVVAAHGATFVLVASAAEEGGALSVLALAADGTLSATDHILDTRDTRFGAVQDMAVVTSGDWVYVVAAGGDGGISLFALIPGGDLVHLDTAIHQTGQGLSGLTTMVATTQGAGVEVLLGSDDRPGLGRVRFDLGDQGQVLRGDATNRTIPGTAGDDLIVGGAGNERLQGQGGNDILTDGAGRDTMEGGAGADTFIPVTDGERDTITGFTPGQDRLDLSHYRMMYDPAQLQIDTTSWGARITWRGEELDVVSASGTGLSRDQVEASVIRAADRPPLVLGDNSDLPLSPDAPRVIEGTSGDDTLTGGAGNDTLLGAGGNNVLMGGAGDDELRGLGGNDIAEGGLGRDRAFLGAGNDLYTDDAQTGREGSDTIFVGEGDDTILGAGGNDIFHGMNGADLLQGGVGDDTIYAGTGFDLVRGGVGNDELWAGEGFDTVFGEAGNDEIFGLPGFDSLDGGAGDDTLWGGDGRDTIIGGTGRDLAYLGTGPDTFIDDPEAGAAGSDEVFMGPGNDSAFGQGGDDVFHGMDGADLLEGGAGNDTLFGGTQADRLLGGDGNDVIWGGLGRDFSQMGSGNDTVNGSAGNDEFHGQDGDDLLEGGAGNDTLFGGSNADRLFGEDGNDVVWGGLGTDYADLGAGDDRFEDAGQGGDLGRDTVFAGAGNDTVNGKGGNDLFHGQDGADLLVGGMGFDTLTGGAGADTLLGQDGHDVLDGGDGADRLEGGRGLDTLTGGADADVFVFSGLTGADLISDFVPGQDQILLDQEGVSTPGDLILSDRAEGLHLGWQSGGVLLEGLFRDAFDVTDIVIL